MAYTISFVSLGCAKNQVNCEQMMALCAAAGHALAGPEDPCDVCVINTCGFIDSAKEEAIAAILEAAGRKAAGQVGRILVTGCLSQRYRRELPEELPEVDGVLGTGSYGEIAAAVDEVMAGGSPRRFGDIHAPVEEGDRVLTTPPYTAYLRIAEGCDNRCAYCIIPQLRGRYRSRPLENVVDEARALSEQGVQELIVVAQDITRYGTDWDGQYHLSELLRRLCQLPFRWIRLHYLYPDEFTDELIDTIAGEPKILKYLDIPLQHCNDAILRRMNRRGTKAEVLALLEKLRARIPGLVLRTSLITGLPGEGEAELTELSDFLREVRIQRAGVFPFSPEEGTAAERMEDRVDADEASRRAELLVDIQSRIMDDFNDSRLGDVIEVLCEGFDGQSMSYMGRSYAESIDIDGHIYFTADRKVAPGEFVPVRATGVMDGELTGELVEP